MSPKAEIINLSDFEAPFTDERGLTNYDQLWRANRTILRTITDRVENPQPKATFQLSKTDTDNRAMWQSLSALLQLQRTPDDLQRGSLTVTVSDAQKMIYAYGGLPQQDNPSAPFDQITAVCTLQHDLDTDDFSITSIEAVSGVPDFVTNLAHATQLSAQRPPVE